MKKWLFIFLLVFLFAYNREKVEANASTIDIIFSDYNVKQNDELFIYLNYNSVSSIDSMQLVLELDNSLFTILDSTPCGILKNSYFQNEEVYVNEYLDNNIRFVAFKKNNLNANFNNLCVIKLKALKSLNDISNYFKDIKISLFDEEYNLVITNYNYTEQLKYEWLVDSYSLLLNEDLPDFSKDIKITNRKVDEYLININTDNINNQVIGSYVVSVYLYDYTNNQTIYLSKSLNILDLTPPIVEGNNEVNILDTSLSNESLVNYKISDNYDLHPEVVIKYYNSEHIEIDNEHAFFTYLQTNLIGYLKIYALDSSKNKSNELIQTIKMSDTTPPVIEYDDIFINDIDVDNFNLFDYLTIWDNYDTNPQFIYNIDGSESLEIVSLLKENYTILLNFYVVDKFLNKTEEATLKITLVDTVCPVIEKLSDLEIKDVEFNNFSSLLYKCFLKSDNFTLPLSEEYQYILEDYVSWEDFKKGLFENKTGNIIITLKDSYNNKSNTIEISVKVIDTTPPIISIDNVIEGKKYLSITDIIYTVTDNFNNELKNTIYIDGKEYTGQTINQIGKHTLTIESIDINNNKSIKVVNFEIIKNNLIGCGADVDCYKTNYMDIIYIALLLFSLSLFIVVIRIALKRRRKRDD